MTTPFAFPLPVILKSSLGRKILQNLTFNWESYQVQVNTIAYLEQVFKKVAF